MRKQVPPDKTKEVLDFATKAPQDRLNSIRNGLSVLNYGIITPTSLVYFIRTYGSFQASQNTSVPSACK